MREMKLQDLKAKTPAELVSFAEELEVENASTMRKQELMFGILKQLSMRETDIVGEGVVEVLSDGFGFLRSPEANYLPGPDDIYVSPSQIRRFGLRNLLQACFQRRQLAVLQFGDLLELAFTLQPHDIRAHFLDLFFQRDNRGRVGIFRRRLVTWDDVRHHHQVGRAEKITSRMVHMRNRNVGKIQILMSVHQ